MTDNPANNPAEVAGLTCPHCGVAIGEHGAESCLNRWVGETITHIVPRRLWIATSDGGKSATRTSEYQHEVEQWVKEHPVVFGKPMWVAHWDIYPRYSSDISAAWEVARHVRDKMEALVSVELRPDSENVVWIYTAKGEYGSIHSNEALAICRAAVLAANEKEKV